MEIQNILAHYKRLGKNEDRYVDSFNNIAAQYNDTQLRIISKFLPLNVRAVLEEKSNKYQQIMSFNNSVSNNLRTNKKEKENTGPKEVLLKPKNREAILSKPVVIPSAVNMSSGKKLSKPKEKIQDTIVEPDYTAKNDVPRQSNNLERNDEKVKTDEEMFEDIDKVANNENNAKQEVVQPVKRGRGRPRKNPVPEVKETETAPKRKRGRPRKNPIPEPEEEKEEPVILPGFEEEQKEEESFLPGVEENNSKLDSQFQKEDMNILPGFEEEEEEKQEDFLPGFEEENTTISPIENSTSNVQNTYSNIENIDNNYDNSNIDNYGYNNYSSNYSNNYNLSSKKEEDNSYKDNIDLSNLLTPDKKIITFVGTGKNGTSFIVNNLAELMSSIGINTVILDTTQNRNSYYIYTKNEEDLRVTASKSIDGLVTGMANGIKVNKNLTVYTSLPSENEAVKNVDRILETLLRNYSLILIDTDFNTPKGYFKQSQETYLVQSMDILTIQPLTAFLKDLKSKNILDEKKLKVILNKVVKIRGIKEETIVGGMAFYNDPAMSFMTELFDRDRIKYISIPFEEETYIRYLEGIIQCEVSLKGYSKIFLQTLKELGNMVYPLIGMQGNNSSYRPPSVGGGNFSPNMNNTLDKMKRNF